MTIRDLLTHTSGIGYAFSDARVAHLVASGTPETEQPLLHDPGERFTYGRNTWVLGKIVEKVSGQALDLFLRRHDLLAASHGRHLLRRAARSS